MDEISILDLKLDFELYPRTTLDGAHVTELEEALNLGAKLPPIIAWRATKQVIDGFHRIRAKVRQRGPNARVEVEWRDYASEADAFADAVRLNASHGLRLRRVDHEHALAKAEALGMTADALSRVMKVPSHRLAKRPTRQATKPGPATYEPPREPGGSPLEPRPLHSDPLAERHPILVVVGQRLEDVKHPEVEFTNSVRAVAQARRADPDTLWDQLVEVAAAALAWAKQQEQLHGAAA